MAQPLQRLACRHVPAWMLVCAALALAATCGPDGAARTGAPATAPAAAPAASPGVATDAPAAPTGQTAVAAASASGTPAAFAQGDDGRGPTPVATPGAAGVESSAAVAAPTPADRISLPAHETVVALHSPTPTPAPATPVPTSTPAPGGAPSIAGCPFFPADNPWNQDISALPVDANSANYIASIGTSGNGFLHADFGGGGAYGIPYIVVPATQPLTPINFTAYGDESDPGPYPVPLDAPVEGGGVGDAHVLAVQQGACKLYEMFDAHPNGGSWDAGSGAIFDLRSNALRPDSWTSADAAGLPILAGLVRYDEVQAGAINHALRFTVGRVQRAWVHPATHYGTSTDVNTPPYGAKLRLKSTFDISVYHGQARVVLEALRRYGMIVADQGTSWYITGAADPRWDDDDLNQLKSVPGAAFEVVQLGPIIRP